MNKKLLASSLMACVIGLACAQDQVSAGGRPLRMTQIPPQKMGLNATDMMALRNIAIANMFEIKSSQLALSRGGSAWTREFGKEMIHEHTGAQNELRSLASSKGVGLPSGLPAAQRAMLSRLAGLHGSAFDSMYRQAQLKGHVQTEMKLRTAMARGHDADVRGFEVKLLPAVVMHKRMAILKQTMMGPTKMMGNHA